MRFLHSVLALLLTPVFVAASFDLESHVSGNGIVYADDKMLDQVLSSQRDYTVAVLLTTSNEKFGCSFCATLNPDFELVASSWRKKHPSGDNLYFVYGEFEKCQRSFHKLGLNSVPNLKIYLPGAAPRGVVSEHLTAEFKSVGPQVNSLVGLLGQQGFHVEIVKPFPWDRFIKTIMTAVAVVTVLFLFRDLFKKFIFSRQPWIAFSMVTVLMFTAGQMFNVTRGTPLIGQQDGRLVYFQPGFSAQLGIETQIVAVSYAILSFLTICLIVKVPKLSTAAIQTVAAVVLAAMVYVGYAYFIAIYNVKYYGYPYSLLPVSI